MRSIKNAFFYVELIEMINYSLVFERQLSFFHSL